MLSNGLKMATYSTNKERTNYARLSRALIDLGTDALRNILQRQVPPAQIKNKLKTCPNSHLQSAGIRAVQWKCINNATTVGSFKEFDITLLYQLLRLLSVQDIRLELETQVPPKDANTAVNHCTFLLSNLTPDELNKVKEIVTFGSYEFCKEELLWKLYQHLCPNTNPNIVHPTLNWGNVKMPDQSHITLGDDVERIRLLRNTVYGHISTTELPDTDFKEYWGILDVIVTRLDHTFTGGQLKQKLDYIKTDCMDQESEKWYCDQIKKLSEEEKEINKEIEKLKSEITDIKIDMSQLGDKTQESLSGMQKVNEKVMGINSSISEMKKNTEKSFVEIKTSMEAIKDENSLSLKKVEENVTQTMLSNIDSKLQQTEEKVDSKIKEIKETVEENKVSYCPYPGAQACKELTNKRIEEHRNDKTFVPTHAVDKGAQILTENGTLIYSGLPGSGKTKNALEVMKRFKDSHPDWLFLKLDSVREWRSCVNPNVHSVVLLDDCIGRSNTDVDLINESESHWPGIQACIKTGVIKVILTVRKHIILKNATQLEKYELFGKKTVLDLTAADYKLTLVNKRDILLHHCSNGNIIISDDFFQENYKSIDQLPEGSPVTLSEITASEIIRNDPVVGFPLSCYLFVSDRKYTKQGADFFKKPTQSLIDEINNLILSESSDIEKIQYCILSYMLLKGGKISMKCLDEEIFNMVVQSVELLKSPTKRHKKEAVDKLNDKYIVQLSDSEFEFKHQTILESIAMCFYDDNPILLLSKCSKDFIKEIVRPPSYKQADGEIVLKVSKDVYSILVERFLEYLGPSDPLSNKSDRYEWWVAHSLMDDEEFVNCFMAIVQSNDTYKQLVKAFLGGEHYGLFAHACSSGKTYLVDKLYGVYSAEGINRWEVSMHWVCIHEHVDTLRWLLDHKIGLRYLMMAFEYANGDQLTCMVSHPTVTHNQVIQALDMMSIRCNGETVKALFTRWPDFEQIHALHLLNNICFYGRHSVIHDIICQRPDIVTQQNMGIAFSWACIGNQVETMECFLNMKHSQLDTNLFHLTQNVEKVTNLHIAAFFGRYDVFVKLEQLGLCFEDESPAGFNVIYMAMLGYLALCMGTHLPNLFRDGKLSEVMYGNPVACFIQSKSAILTMICCEIERKICFYGMKTGVSVGTKNYIKIFTRIIDHTSKPGLNQCVDDFGHTLVHYSILYNDVELIQVLHQASKDLIHSRNNEDMTVIHLAAFFGKWKVFSKLIELGSRVGDMTKSGLSMLQLAMIGFACGGVCEDCALSIFIQKKSPALVHYCAHGRDTLRIGSISDFWYVFSCLMDKSEFKCADLDLVLDHHGNTFIYYCIVYDAPAIVELLFKKYPGCVSIQNALNLKPIHFAVLLGRNEIFEFLFSVTELNDSVIKTLQELLQQGCEHAGRRCSWHIKKPKFLTFLPVGHRCVMFGKNNEFTLISTTIQKMQG